MLGLGTICSSADEDVRHTLLERFQAGKVLVVGHFLGLTLHEVDEQRQDSCDRRFAAASLALGRSAGGVPLTRELISDSTSACTMTGSAASC